MPPPQQNRLASASRPQPSAGAPMFHRVIEANPMAVRQALIDLADRFAPHLPAEQQAHLEITVAEILNNIVEHAYHGQAAGFIHISVVQSDAGLFCAIADDGAVLPAECLGPRDHPGEATDAQPHKIMHIPEGGFGWMLIQGLTQNLCYYRENDRNFLAFCLPVGSSAQATAAKAST